MKETTNGWLLQLSMVLMFCAVPGFAQAAFHGAHATKSRYSVIFQIDSGGRGAIKKTLVNVENLLNDPRLRGKLRVELVANSKGFDVYVKNNGFEKQLLALKKQGVILAQCNNTLHELHVDRSDLYPFITIVPSGVGEIAIREAEGWAYIHPIPPVHSAL